MRSYLVLLSAPATCIASNLFVFLMSAQMRPSKLAHSFCCQLAECLLKAHHQLPWCRVAMRLMQLTRPAVSSENPSSILTIQRP